MLTEYAAKRCLRLFAFHPLRPNSDFPLVIFWSSVDDFYGKDTFSI